MAYYFTSDTHFGHINILRHCRRPFASIKEMDEALLEKWAELKANDSLFHLGDVAKGNFDQLAAVISRIRKISCKKYLIPGNHDMNFLNLYAMAFTICPLVHHIGVQRKKVETVHLILSHYPLYTWERREKGYLQLYGHVHSRFLGNKLQTDVGVDAWDYAPVTLEQIQDRLATLNEPIRLYK